MTQACWRGEFLYKQVSGESEPPTGAEIVITGRCISQQVHFFFKPLLLCSVQVFAALTLVCCVVNLNDSLSVVC